MFPNCQKLELFGLGSERLHVMKATCLKNLVETHQFRRSFISLNRVLNIEKVGFHSWFCCISSMSWMLHRGRPHNVHENWIICGNQLDGVRLVDDELVKRPEPAWGGGSLEI